MEDKNFFISTNHAISMTNYSPFTFLSPVIYIKLYIDEQPKISILMERQQKQKRFLGEFKKVLSEINYTLLNGGLWAKESFLLPLPLNPGNYFYILYSIKFRIIYNLPSSSQKIISIIRFRPKFEGIRIRMLSGMKEKNGGKE